MDGWERVRKEFSSSYPLRAHTRACMRGGRRRKKEGRGKERRRRGRRSSPPPYVPMRAGGREEKGERRGCAGVSPHTSPRDGKFWRERDRGREKMSGWMGED